MVLFPLRTLYRNATRSIFGLVADPPACPPPHSRHSAVCGTAGQDGHTRKEHHVPGWVA